MPTQHVPFPDNPPVSAGHYKRSRRPLIVFGPRGPVDRKTDWAAEETAVTKTAPGEKYPTCYLGPWIRLEQPDDEQRALQAFRELLTWQSVVPMIEVAGVCVPRWPELPTGIQERLQVAVGLRPVVGNEASPLVLGPASKPLPVLYPLTGRRRGALEDVPPARRFVTSRESHLTWLNRAKPAIDDMTAYFMAVVGRGDGPPPRDFATARDVAAELLAQGRSRPFVQAYLEIFGFKNSKGLVGVWPANRLAEVAEVRR